MAFFHILVGKNTLAMGGKIGILADVKKLKSHLLNVHFVSSEKKYPDTMN